MRVLLTLARYLALGPITGYLAGRALHHRKGAPVLASLYIIAACMAWVDLPLVLRGLLAYIAAHR